MLKINKNIDNKNKFESIINNIEYNYLTSQQKSSIKDLLINEQKDLCCYCCKKISTNKSSIEHIAPKSKYGNINTDYYNLLCSCMSDMTCNHYKADKYDEKLFISPLEENCEDYFCFNVMTGEIIPNNKLSVNIVSRANYTICVLNLNHSSIKLLRKNIFKELSSFTKDDIECIFLNEQHSLPLCYDAIKFYLRLF